MVYYALYIPLKKKNDDEDLTFIYEDKEEAMKMLKTFKDARFKKFIIETDAINFSRNGMNGNGNASFNSSDRKVATPTPKNLEKSNFKAPKSHELIKFRKEVEANNLNIVYQTVWENPKYLVSSGDTPSILKEGPRYNALHVAAIAKHAQMCKLILQTVEKTSFMELLHGTRNDATDECTAILLDSYLNTPDKSRSETPLHFAVKFGALSVVEALIAYPQCKMLPNSEGFFPKDIVCSRVNDPEPEIVGNITALLKERFFVPVYRSIDNSTPPMIGEPFSPTDVPALENDRFSPQLEIKAYAGPMDKDQAKVFGKRWKTPPRIISSPLFLMNISPNTFETHSTPVKNDIMSTPKSSTKSRFETRRLFADNLLDSPSTEIIPNGTVEKLANDPKKIDLFKQYRNRLNSSFADDSNNSFTFFADANNSFYEYDNIQNSPSYKERELRITDMEKGLEIIGRNLASELRIGWKEYWDFLGTFIDINSDDGLKQFDDFLKNKKVYRTATPHQQHSVQDVDIKKIESSNDDSMSDLCNALFTIDLNNEWKNSAKQKNSATKPMNTSHHAGKENMSDENKDSLIISPFICIEKSCQVYAKRFVKGMVNNINEPNTFFETLNSELLKLHQLVESYRTDERFRNVYFNRIYSRYAHLVASYVKYSTDLNVEFKHIKDKLNKLEFQPVIQQFNGSPYSNISNLCVMKTYEFILNYFNNPHEIVNSDIIEDEAKCTEVWLKEDMYNCTCQIKSKTRRRLTEKKKELLKIDSDVLQKRVESPIIPRSFSDSTDLKSIVKNNHLWNFRTNNEISSDEEDETGVNDNDIFLSCESSSEDEENLKWLTPSQSPVMFGDDEEDYANFIDGREPTKQDVNVLNALSHRDIDPFMYPNVRKWKFAMAKYSKEEKESFPSPAHKVKFVVGKLNAQNLLNGNNTSSILSSSNLTSNSAKLNTSPKKLTWQRALNFDNDEMQEKSTITANMYTL